MLKLLKTAPAALAKRAEVSRFSGRFDAATQDTGDLRVFVSADGSRQYLRVWEMDETAPDGQARWYEIIPPPVDPTSRK